MPIIIIAIVFFGGLVFSMPLLLILRYRAGTMRRRGRKWAATLNLIGLLVSATLFLWFAAMTTIWVPNAFTYSRRLRQRMPSRFARAGLDPLGTDAARALLHAQSRAGLAPNARRHSTLTLWPLANLARLARRGRQ